VRGSQRLLRAVDLPERLDVLRLARRRLRDRHRLLRQLRPVHGRQLVLHGHVRDLRERDRVLLRQLHRDDVRLHTGWHRVLQRQRLLRWLDVHERNVLQGRKQRVHAEHRVLLGHLQDQQDLHVSYFNARSTTNVPVS
jgi:hypothetical protein